MEITIIEALQKLLPNVEWKITDNDLTTLEILSDFDGLTPTQKQIDDAIKTLQNEYELAQTTKAAEKQQILAQLGITEEQAKLLLS